MNGNGSISTKEFYDNFHAVRREMAKIVMGQEQVITHLLAAVFAGGHVLLKGFPGLGRTLIVKSLSDILGLDHGRIQFTPDLLPTDITGTEVLEHNAQTGERSFHFFKGPVFANMVLADEVNRSPARSQAALLEVMQEKQITMGGQTYFLPKPFMIVATQNTLDHEGVFMLGEAQVDRFIMMIEQDYPTESEERAIVRSTTGTYRPEIRAVTDPQTILAMQALAQEVPVVPSVKAFAMSIVRSSRPKEASTCRAVVDNVRLGASPRATQALIKLAKVIALSCGRRHVTKQDIMEVAYPVLAHRLLVDFRAQAKGRDGKYVIKAMLRDAVANTVPKGSIWMRDVLKIEKQATAGLASVPGGQWLRGRWSALKKVGRRNNRQTANGTGNKGKP
jgi:MoxR-like ATPase